MLFFSEHIPGVEERDIILRKRSERKKSIRKKVMRKKSIRSNKRIDEEEECHNGFINIYVTRVCARDIR